jgi:hypothetical protein
MMVVRVAKLLGRFAALRTALSVLPSCALVTSFDEYGVGSGDDTFEVRGTVVGLEEGRITLVLNGREIDPPEGPFVFPTRLANGARYTLTIDGVPPDHTCAADKSAGVVTGADVIITIACVLVSTNKRSAPP